MNRPRIAYVINSLEGGGAAQPIPAIGSVLRNAGADVRVFALTGRDRRALTAIREAGLAPLVREGGESDHLAALSWLCKAVREWEATHLWTSLSRATILGLLAAPTLGLPVICWQHNAYLKPWNRRLMRWLQSRARLWIGDSTCVTQLTGERLSVEAQRLLCWPLFAVGPEIRQARAWHPDEPLRLGSLGRLHRAKGYDVLIDAVARLKSQGWSPPVPIQIEIAGEGAERGRLEALARLRDINEITFTGFADRPHAFLGNLHLYLQPSRREGFCIAAHEALASGLPVIASATGELAHTVSAEIGRTVKPECIDSLASALRDLIGNPESLADMGRMASAEMSIRFSVENFEAAGKAAFAASINDHVHHDGSTPRART
jgi:glycosyltransferase involved in cell wall biosynthesis